jgi:MSHA biogenesis protein MshQ
VITAGAPFQLSAAAVIGYNGIPTIDNSKLTGTPIAGVLSGHFSAANPLTGTASGAGFSYSEVGHFGLNANAVFDANFTQVDQPNDCLAGFSNTLSAGRYGCSIGSTAVPFAVDNSGFGRFIPARFNLSANTPRLLPACNGFTYLGQPFDYLTSPQLTLTAQNTGGATTLNYDGSYWKHSSNLSGHSYTSNAASSATLTITTAGSVAWNGIADSDGVGRANLSGEFLAYTKPAASEPPFEADVNLTFSAVDLTDSDGVCYDPDINGICNPFTISNITGSEQRYGQMQLQNAYGPETLPLTIPVFTEYFDGTGFVLNVSDICTTYDSLNATLANPQGNLALNETAITGNGTLISGVGNNLSLAAPGVGNDGSADVTLDLSQATGANMQWLQPGGINPNPNARATFGIFRGNDRLIYMRESIW